MVKFLKYKEYISRVLHSILLFLPAFLYSRMVQHQERYRHVWLISERGSEARDNAYHLFRFIREQHPEINAWFVLTKDSPDMHKVECYQNIVSPRTFQHFILFILADKLISTHEYGAAPYAKGSKYLLKLLPKKHHVFLKHGITKDKYIIKDEINDLIVCASDKEVQLFQESPGKVVQSIKAIGFCRFDNLTDKSAEQAERIILLMPTFRFWLEDAGRLSNKDEIFRNDPYFIFWNGLLSNRRFQDFCKENGYRVVFYPHFRSQKYLNNFKGYPEHFTIADNKTYDIQDLLIRSSIMVTDFSSVFFDFTYMRKPVVYYQFDEVKYRSLQYKEGDFLYRRDGFGPVFGETDQIVDYVISRSKADFRLEEVYLERTLKFFKYHDRENTKRNFETIISLS